MVSRSSMSVDLLVDAPATQPPETIRNFFPSEALVAVPQAESMRVVGRSGRDFHPESPDRTEKYVC